MDDVDYTEKIATFNLLVGNNNEEIAMNYLTITNWDETKAAMLYNQENKGANAKIQTSVKIPSYQYQNQYSSKNNNKLNVYGNNYISQTYREPRPVNNKLNLNFNKLNKYKSCEIYKKSFFDSFKIFKTDNRGYFPNFSNIYKKCVKLYNNFIIELRNNVGVILIYEKRGFNEALNVLRNITENELTKDILNNKTKIIPLIKGCLEADKIIKELKIKSFPTIVICFYKSETHFAVVAQINKVNENIKLLNEKLIEAHDLFEEGEKTVFSKKNISSPKNQIYNNTINNNINQNMNNNINKNINNNINNNKINDIYNDTYNNINNNIYNNINSNTNINNDININSHKKENLLDDLNNYLPEEINGVNNRNSDLNDIKREDSYTYLSDAEVLARQEREMKRLEKLEEEKRLEEERKEREKKVEEEKKKQEELIEKVKTESIINMLPEEPSDDNPEKCVILFRFPDGEKSVQRKFLKTDPISMLYLYVKSLGREIYIENEDKNFSLIQSFPFKNFDEAQNNTLEQEGLFPNAVLQIKSNE